MDNDEKCGGKKDRVPAWREINWKLLEGPLPIILDKNRGFIRNDRIISYVHKDEAVELGTFK